jgi:hypothetical protein
MTNMVNPWGRERGRAREELELCAEQRAKAGRGGGVAVPRWSRLRLLPLAQWSRQRPEGGSACGAAWSRRSSGTSSERGWVTNPRRGEGRESRLVTAGSVLMNRPCSRPSPQLEVR